MPRKEWEMAFAVTANMGSGFQSTFSKAQQQIVNLQKDIQTLNKEQADIASYQKQQQAAESTTRKLEVLQQQYDNIQREIGETGEFSSDLENKLLSKQLQIDKTSQSLERQTAELNRMGDSLRDAGIDTDNLADESQRLEAELNDLKQQQSEVADGAQDFGDRGTKAFEAISGALAAAGIAQGLKEIYDAYAQCVSIAGDFEASMSNVEALSGANAGELARLSDMAKELGATTKFTAKESADAMGYMAMAGWSAEQMLSGMPGVLSLAAASGEDLATVSDIVTDSMTAFGLKASETQRYADILAQTSSKANTNVSMMGETFKYAAPLAGSLGYSVEDVAVATGLMANAGIKAGEAGTALRTLFTRLAKPTKESADAMDALGVSLTDDAGKMIPFMDIMKQLRTRFSELTEEEQAFYAAELAGQRGMSGLLAIVNAGESDFTKLAAAISDSSGAAQRMADIKMNNMVGQLTILNSAYEALQTTIGEQFTPDLENMYSWGAQVLGQINDFIKRNPELVKGVTVTVGVIGAATAAVVAFAAVKKLAAAIELPALFASAGPVLAVAGAVAVLTGAVVALTSAERRMMDNELSAKSKKEQAELNKLEAEYRRVCDAMGETSAEAQILKKELDQATQAFEASKMTVKEAAEAHQAFMDSYREMESRFADERRELDLQAESSENLMNQLLHLVDAEGQTAEQKQRILTLVDMLNESVPDLGLAYDEETNSINMTADAVRNLVKAEYDAERQRARLDEMKERMANEAEYSKRVSAARAAAAEKQEAYNAALAQYNEMQSKFDDIVDETYYQIMGIYAKALGDAREEMNAANAVYDEAFDAYIDNEYAIRLLSEGLAEYSDVQRSASGDAALMNDILDQTLSEIGRLAAAYTEAYNAAYESINGQYALWDEAADVAAKKAGDINAALESQRKYWDEYNANLASLGERTGDIEGLREVIASFADGSEDSVNAIAGMAQASDEDLAAMVANWQELQKTHDETAKNIAEFKTDFTNQMDELTGQIKDDIKELELGDEAAENGRATIQAYIDAVDEMLPEVQAAFERLGQAADFGLTLAHGNKIYNDTQHYASGTESAEPGLALVGESGPELMMMHGGEEILNASLTRRLMAENAQITNIAPLLAALSAQPVSAAADVGTAAPVSVSVNFQIDGNASEATVEALYGYGEEFAERVRAVLEEAGIEASRREYR